MARGYNAFSDVIKTTADGADLNRMWTEFQATLQVQNDHRSAIASLFSTPTQARAEAVAQGISGSSFEEASEFGEPQGLRVSPLSGRLGFPFKWWDIGLRYTWKWLSEASAEQVTAVHNSALEADNRLVFNQVLRALMFKTGIGTRDFTEDGVSVYGLWDGDTDSTPPDFAGTSFAAGHQHYLTSGATLLDSGDVEALITHVAHHGFGQQDGSRIFILANPVQADVMAGFRANVVNNNAAIAKWDFVPSMAAPAYLSAESVVGERPPAAYAGLKISGSYGDAWIATDPFVPAGYVLVVASAGPNSASNPLAIREHVRPELRGLKLWAGGSDYPLTDSFYQHGLGVGVRQRGAAAVMQITSSGTYTNPTIAVS
ncbi:MAG: hypothetical protein JWM76_902 [Pseudonocardiales bacterium]|nr:hypothetical protein [Pseudonocardiales bacterium]